MLPVAKSLLGPNVPSPFPSSTETVLEELFATTRSGLPSPFRSPIATELGYVPVPEQHRDSVVAVGHRQVRLAVPVQIPDRHGNGIGARPVVAVRPERPVA